MNKVAKKFAKYDLKTFLHIHTLFDVLKWLKKCFTEGHLNVCESEIVIPIFAIVKKSDKLFGESLKFLQCEVYPFTGEF